MSTSKKNLISYAGKILRLEEMALKPDSRMALIVVVWVQECKNQAINYLIEQLQSE